MPQHSSPPDGRYKRLSGQDAAFLSFEGAGRPMHIGALALIEAAPWLDASGTLDTTRLRDTLVERATAIRGLDRRLSHTPLGWPIWVREPAPGWHSIITVGAPVSSRDEARAVVEAAMASHLDRDLPLWRVEVLPGLDGGATFAILFIAHHAFVDGIAGMDLLRRFLDGADATPRTVRAGTPPTARRLLRDDLGRWASLPAMLGSRAFSLATDPGRRRDVVRRGKAFLRTCVRLLTPGPTTSLHGSDEGERGVSWFDVPDRPFLLARRPLLGSANDMLLAAVSHALGGLRGHGTTNNTRAAIPVSLRTRAERHDLGNRLGLLLTPLEVPTREARQRVARIRHHTAEQKRRGDAEGYEVLGELTAWTGLWSQRLLHWLARSLRSYGILITNVPGPSRPHTLGGAEVRELYPFVPLFGGQSVSVAIVRYRGAFRVGVTSSWPDRVDLDEFTARLRDAFAVLAHQGERSPALPSDEPEPATQPLAS